MASQPIETLGNDEWPSVLQHLALSVVAALCATSRSVRSAIDSAEVWSGLCVAFLLVAAPGKCSGFQCKTCTG